MNIDEKKFDTLIAKIDVLTSVIALTSNLPSNFRDLSKQDQIKTIYQFNSKIDRNIIAIIVGTTPDTVSSRLSEMRKKGEIK
ncbi:hypothetical protein KQH27_00840 [bacterium]|nr:hypothetical protein [bacterium]